MCKAETILELQSRARTGPLWMVTLVLFIHNAVLGLSFYYASVTLPYHATGTHGYVRLTEDEDTSYVSLHQITMLIGSFLSHPLGEWLGRKKVLILSNLLTILSFVMMYLSTGFPLLLTGRLISGFSVGLGILLPLVLISEVATIKARPGMANSVNLAISFGGLMVYFINMAIPPEYLAFSIIFFSVVFLILSVTLKESPQWLIRNGRLDEAEEVYRFLRGAEYRGVAKEVDEVVSIVDKSNQHVQKASRWRSPTFLFPMGVLGFLFSVIGLCGLDAPLTLYGPRMFAEFGFDIPYKIVMLIIPTGGFVGYVVASPLLGIMKKKHQFTAAALLMAVSTTLLGVAYYCKELEGGLLAAQILLGAGSLGLTFGYGAGLGAVIYTLPGELLSPEDKTLGLSIAECFRLIWTAGVVKVYPLFLELVGYTVMFGFHTLVLVLSACFVLRYLPETKNKSLSELQDIFKKAPPPPKGVKV